MGACGRPATVCGDDHDRPPLRLLGRCPRVPARRRAAGGAQVADQLRELSSRTTGRALPEPMVAINQRYASAAQVIRAGDEVAIIPPVAGG
ncbi:MAG: MoaD/ThiS family protein [Gemmatimonadota bacterium]